MLAGRRRPFTLVLDDVHELVGRDVAGHAADAGRRAASRDRGSCSPDGRRSRCRSAGCACRRRLVEVGPAELAFDEREAALLFAELGIDVPPGAVGPLVERTEGWPVALYLAALAHASGRTAMTALADDFTGDHRFLVDYLGEELLADLDPGRRGVPARRVVPRSVLRQPLRRRARTLAARRSCSSVSAGRTCS